MGARAIQNSYIGSSKSSYIYRELIRAHYEIESARCSRYRCDILRLYDEHISTLSLLNRPISPMRSVDIKGICLHYEKPILYEELLAAAYEV